MPVSLPYEVQIKKPFINLLLYGSPGSGKTVLASTAQKHPDMQNVLFLNFEGGLLSIGSMKGVRAVDIKSVDEVEEVFWKLINKDKGWDHFQTIVIDSGSELQTLSLQQLATDAFKRDRDTKGERAKRISQDDLWQEDYGKDSARLKRIFRWFRDAPFHVIITALSKKVYSKPASRDSEPQLLDVVPAFTDKLGTAVMGYCDFVWYMFVDGDGKRHILTRDKAAFRAKTRGQAFAKAIGETIVDPDLAKLYSMLIETEGPQK